MWNKGREASHTFVDCIPAIVYIAAPGRRRKWHYVSPRIEAILGFQPELWLSDADLWFRQVHPADRGQLLNNEGISISCHPKNQIYVAEYRMYDRMGKIVSIRDEGIILCNSQGHPLIHGMMIDITGLRKAQESRLRLEQELRQAEKFVAIGQFARRFAHDFTNILMTVSGCCELLMMKTSSEDSSVDEIREIQQAAQRGVALTHQLLLSSRSDESAAEDGDVD